MCETCGCGEASAGIGRRDGGHDLGREDGHGHGRGDGHGHGHGHGHDNDHAHDHDHDHDHAHDHGHAHDHVVDDAPRRIALGAAVLAHNDSIAAENRRFLASRGVRMIDLISSPGSGKTALLEATLDALANRIRLAVLVGDVRTDNDARRLSGRGVPVRQIETGGACHLDATDVRRHLPDLVSGGLDLLIVENVGNLVCPAAFDLGQSTRVALLSVTEGEDKPLKYPALFHRAPVVVITKTDLVPHLRWDRAACLANIRAVRPDARVLELSAQTGEGLGAWLELLVAERAG